MKFTIELSQEETDALFELALRERHNPRAQIAITVRRDLQRRGLLASDAGAMRAARVAYEDREPQPPILSDDEMDRDEVAALAESHPFAKATLTVVPERAPVRVYTNSVNTANAPF